MQVSLLPGVFLGAAALMLSTSVQAQTQGTTIESSAGNLTAVVLVEGLSHPWGLAILPDGRMLVTERSGQLRLIDNGTISEPIGGTPNVYAEGQGGLLDVALAPDFETSGQIYLTFSERAEDAGLQRGQGTALLKARLVLNEAGGQLEDQEVIFRMNNFTATNRHFGSRVVVGNDGNLFVTLGDRGAQDRAQDVSDLAGGVARIAPDGSIPSDNPQLEGWAPELWSKGHRNPQGATLRADGALFLVEHGARGGDEVNMPLAGRNYGWPDISYGVDYSGIAFPGTEAEGMEQPLHYWDPSISPSGLDFYEGELIAGWDGDLLSGGLSGQVLVRLDMEGDTVVGEERLFEGQLGRIRDVRVGDDGAIYLLTDAENGQLIRVAPEGS